MRLPADYVADHVELGYATTIHRAQGATLDTAHALLDERTTREALYVAATRGRTSNHLYLDTGTPDSGHDSGLDGGQNVDVLDHDTGNIESRVALAAALTRSTATASAHAALANAETRRREEAAHWDAMATRRRAAEEFQRYQRHAFDTPGLY